MLAGCMQLWCSTDGALTVQQLVGCFVASRSLPYYRPSALTLFIYRTPCYLSCGGATCMADTSLPLKMKHHCKRRPGNSCNIIVLLQVTSNRLLLLLLLLYSLWPGRHQGGDGSGRDVRVPLCPGQPFFARTVVSHTINLSVQS